jgi:hypothetical protein
LGVRNTIIGQVRALARGALDLRDLLGDLVERGGHQPVHRPWVIALDEARRVAVALQQRAQLLAGYPREHGGASDLVAVEVQHGQHRAVAHGVEELVRVPTRGQRAGFGLAVADRAADEQVGVVERGAVGVNERVAQLAALVDRAGRLGRDVAGDAAGEGELAKQPSHSLLVVADMRVDLGVGALQVDVGDDARAAVAGARDVDGVQVARADDAVHVRVEEVQAGGGSPVAEQPRLGVLESQRLAQQRVREQVDLADRQVVGGTPVGVDGVQFVLGGRGVRAAHARIVRHDGPAGVSRKPQLAGW